MSRPLPTEPCGHSKERLNFLLFSAHTILNGVLFAVLCYFVYVDGSLDSMLSTWGDFSWSMVGVGLFFYLFTLAIEPGGMPLHNDEAVLSLLSHFAMFPILGLISDLPLSETLLYLCGTELICIGIIFPSALRSFYEDAYEKRTQLAEEVSILKAEGKKWEPDLSSYPLEHQRLISELDEEGRISLLAMSRVYQRRMLDEGEDTLHIAVKQLNKEALSNSGCMACLGMIPVFSGLGLLFLLVVAELSGDYQSHWYVLIGGVLARIMSGYRSMKAGLEAQLRQSNEIGHPWLETRWEHALRLHIFFFLVAIGGGLLSALFHYVEQF